MSLIGKKITGYCENEEGLTKVTGIVLDKHQHSENKEYKIKDLKIDLPVLSEYYLVKDSSDGSIKNIECYEVTNVE